MKQIKVCKTEKEANDFMQNKSVTDIKILTIPEEGKMQFYFIVFYTIISK